jgi:hypothetical protein
LYIGRNVSEKLAVSIFSVVLFLRTKATSSLETFGDRVIQKERSTFWEMIISVIVSKIISYEHVPNSEFLESTKKYKKTLSIVIKRN